MSGWTSLALAMGSRLLVAAVLGGALAAAVWLLCRLRPGLRPGVRRWLWWAVSFELLAALLPLPVWRLAILPEPLVAAASAARGAVDPGAGETVRAGAAGLPATTTAATAADATLTSAAVVETLDAGVRRPRPAKLLAGVATASTERLALGTAVAVGAVLLWAAGVLLALAAACRDLARVRLLVRRARRADDPALAARFSRLAGELGTPGVRLRLSPLVETPQVVGAFAPVVLLPADAAARFAPEELELTLAHELVHVRHRDLLLGLVPALAQRLFFFHPAAALAAREHALAREAACDAAVIERLSPSRRAYGRLLLKLSLVPRSPLPAAMAVVTQRTLHRRLEMLLDPRRPSRAAWAWLALPAAFALLLPLRLTAWQGEEPAAATGAAAERAADPAADPAATARREAGRAGSGSPPADVREAIEAARVGEPAGAVEPTEPVEPAELAEPGGLRVGIDGRRLAVLAALDAERPQDPDGERIQVHFGRGDSRQAWVLFDGDSTSMSGTEDDIRVARSLRRGDEDLLWVRNGDEAYVVRDPAVLAAVDAAMEPQRELGRRQAELGSRQATLGAEQAELGARQAALGAEQAELGQRQSALGAEHSAIAARLARLAADEARLAAEEMSAGDGEARRAIERRREELERARRPLEEEMDRLGDEQRRLGREQAELGSRQGELGQLQGELGSRQGELGSRQGDLGSLQAEAAERAQREVLAIAARAAREGKAERVRP